MPPKDRIANAQTKSNTALGHSWESVRSRLPRLLVPAEWPVSFSCVLPGEKPGCAGVTMLFVMGRIEWGRGFAGPAAPRPSWQPQSATMSSSGGIAAHGLLCLRSPAARVSARRKVKRAETMMRGL